MVLFACNKFFTISAFPSLLLLWFISVILYIMNQVRPSEVESGPNVLLTCFHFWLFMPSLSIQVLPGRVMCQGCTSFILKTTTQKKTPGDGGEENLPLRRWVEICLDLLGWETKTDRSIATVIITNHINRQLFPNIIIAAGQRLGKMSCYHCCTDNGTWSWIYFEERSSLHHGNVTRSQLNCKLYPKRLKCREGGEDQGF